MTRNVIPSPVEKDGIVYVMSGFRGSALQAIRFASARGDITGTDAIVWEHERDTPYTSSPLLYDGALYFMKSNSNILSVFDAKTGERFYRDRLRELGDVFSSPVGAAGRVYITGREGSTVVLQSGPELKVLAVNELDDEIDASMVVVDKDIYLRGSRYLYRITE
jgi:outer membrane protein assembly factor BamB